MPPDASWFVTCTACYLCFTWHPPCLALLPPCRTELCRSWEETGSCRYGAKCQASEIRFVPSRARSSPPCLPPNLGQSSRPWLRPNWGTQVPHPC